MKTKMGIQRKRYAGRAFVDPVDSSLKLLKIMECFAADIDLFEEAWQLVPRRKLRKALSQAIADAKRK